MRQSIWLTSFTVIGLLIAATLACATDSGDSATQPTAGSGATGQQVAPGGSPPAATLVPTPTPTPAPARASPVRQPTATSTLGVTPVRATRTPTPTPIPTATPTRESAPVPTRIPQATPDPTVAPTVAPDRTPTPTPRPIAAPASVPTHTPPTPTSTRPAPTPTPQEQPTLDFPWTKRPPSTDEYSALKGLWHIQYNFPGLAGTVFGLPWVIGGPKGDELKPLSLLSRVSEDNAAMFRRLVALPWFADGITNDESRAFQYLTEISLEDPALAGDIAGFRWLADGITAPERAVLLDLSMMAVLEDQAAEAGRIAGLSWLRDDIATYDGIRSVELGAVRLLKDLYRKDPSLADGFISLAWVADGISQIEFGAFREIGVILNADVSSVRLLAETPWFADGISPEELQPLSTIARLSAGGITSAESREISAILAAGVSSVTAAATPVPTQAPAVTATPEPTLPPPRFGELYRAVEAIAPIELIEQVIDRGADINEVVELGETPLHVSAAATYIPAVRLLLERGADVDPRDINGSTPLARYMHTPDPDPDVVALFLGYGSDVNAKDNNGRTPLYYAETRGLGRVAALLRSKGAETGQEVPVEPPTPSPTPRPTTEAEDRPEVETPDPNAKENHDTDGDGLIEIHYLEQLSAIRYDPDGDGVPLDTNDLDGAVGDDFTWGTSAQWYSEAFPVTPGGTVCGTASGCTGYELARSLDFDDPGSYLAPSARGTGWQPILVCHDLARRCTRKVTLTFDGNGHTISNLTVQGWGPSGLAGLFFRMDGTIRNVGLLDVDMESRTGAPRRPELWHHHRQLRYRQRKGCQGPYNRIGSSQRVRGEQPRDHQPQLRRG